MSALDKDGFSEHPLMLGVPPAWAAGWGDDDHGVFAWFDVRGISYTLRWIPPGRFQMGSPDTEVGRFDNEERRLVSVEGFWLGETPCTQELWQAVMGENPSHFKGKPDSARRPVEQVSFEDCLRFCERLRELVPGLEPRLPAEAEWEYACRADTETATYAGDLRYAERDTVLDGIAWYAGNSGHETHAVRDGRKRPNRWGLFDMLGNVYEWCDTEAGKWRVLRGGCWRSDARRARAACRLWRYTSIRDDDFGFRFARGQEDRPGR